MYYLEIDRGEGWWLVGQYATRREAETIARDYRSRGVRARVVREDG